MREHVRRTRRERDGHGAAPAAHVPASLLELQRSAGNRAVQRLFWEGKTGTVFVPNEYGAQRIPFDLKNGVLKDDEKTTNKDPTLVEVLRHTPTMISGVQHGLNVPWLNALTTEPDTSLAARGNAAASPQTDNALKQKLADAAQARNRVVIANPSVPLTTANADEKTPLVLRPLEYFAQKPDLPKAGTPLSKTVPGKGKLTYYHYTCVLIALVKQTGGEDFARQLTHSEDITDTETAVQALHDHYMREKVQYDDTSTRFQIMEEWGYDLIFSGESGWMELGKHVPLNGDTKYVFDIPGHTVLVTAKKDLPATLPKNPNLSDYFQTHSDPKNYGEKETAKPVRYVWKKR